MGRRDLPAVDPKLPDAIRRPLVRAIEEVQTLLGLRGDRLDAALTWNDLKEQGMLRLRAIGASGGSGGSGQPGVITVPGSEPDLTPPPDVTGLTVSAGFAHVMVQFDAPAYTQGGGNGQTNLYAAKRASTDASLPTFTDAVRVFEAMGPLNIVAIPSELGIRWHVWAKHQSADGVESPNPAGGVNGVSAQTGKIGSVDLAPLVVQAEHLAAATNSVIPDTSFAAGATAWAGWLRRVDRLDPAVPVACPTSTAAEFGGSECLYAQRVPVRPGDDYYLTSYAHRFTAPGAAMIVYAYDANGAALGSTVLGAVTTDGWQQLQGSYTVPAGAAFLRAGPLLSQAPGASGRAWFGDFYVQKKIDANLISANTIVAGTAAIANAAIVRAMIGLAAVDDARIKDLSAAKLTVGDGTVGGNLKSSNYASGSAGWLLRPDGFAELSNVVIRGATYTGSIFANAGLIGGIEIYSNNIQSANYAPGTNGFILRSDGTGQIGGVAILRDRIRSANFSSTRGFEITWDGFIVCRDMIARGNIEATSLKAATGTLGTITSGFLRNPAGTTVIDMDATGTENFLWVNSGKVRILANGDAYFTAILASGTWTGSVALIAGVPAQPVEAVFYIDTGFNSNIAALLARSISARTANVRGQPSGGSSPGLGNLDGIVRLDVRPVIYEPMFSGGGNANAGQNPYGSNAKRVFLRVSAYLVENTNNRASYALTRLDWTLDAIG